MRTETEVNGKKIAIGMTEIVHDKLSDMVDTIPEYNCIKSLVEDCISCFERRIKARNMQDEIPAGFISRMPYIITKQQIAFLNSGDADEMFSEDILHKEYLEQIRKYIA